MIDKKIKTFREDCIFCEYRKRNNHGKLICGYKKCEHYKGMVNHRSFWEVAADIGFIVKK